MRPHRGNGAGRIDDMRDARCGHPAVCGRGALGSKGYDPVRSGALRGASARPKEVHSLALAWPMLQVSMALPMLGLDLIQDVA